MFYFLKQFTSIILDSINAAKPEQILTGKKMFRPFMEYQKSWMTYFYPGETISADYPAWFYLQKYMMPLIKTNASYYHIEGIRRLNLDADQQPDFNEFQHLFANASNGFKIQPVFDEIEPKEYFTLIQQKKFPCINRMRSKEELFCADEPDFWHEAIGHLAPLCFQEVQEFYLQIADYMLAAKTKKQFERQLAVAWTLLEYGFIKEHGQNKMFGAALVGSHLANMRFLKGLIKIEPANRAAIIDSGFSEVSAPLPRDNNGHMRYFYLDHLKIAQLFDAY